MADRTREPRTSPGAVLITGGTRGIGLGIARALASDGWDLLLSGVRGASEVAEVLADLQTLTAKVQYVAGDISKAAGRSTIIEQVRTHYGALNALVNNA